jgi:UDP-N-acetylglucosamine 1-carboxyvinyltransferase
MCLVVAGLVADGVTRLSNVQELQRKYDNLVPKLQAMGADIRVVEVESTRGFASQSFISGPRE